MASSALPGVLPRGNPGATVPVERSHCTSWSSQNLVSWLPLSDMGLNTPGRARSRDVLSSQSRKTSGEEVRRNLHPSWVLGAHVKHLTSKIYSRKT